MEINHTVTQGMPLPDPSVLSLGSVIAIGNFDGVHLGHRELLKKARELSLSLQKDKEPPKTIAMTFWPHPRIFFQDPSFKLIYPPKERDQLILGTKDADYLISLPFTKELMSLHYEDFFRKILLEQYHAKGIVIGDNFHFGKGGEGSSETMVTLGQRHGVSVLVIPRKEYDHVPISSTRIRQALREGKIEEVNKMLGVPYHHTGMVVHGKGVGHQLSTPTVNLMLEEGMEAPEFGVYASRIITEGKTYQGISNVGDNPTFGREAPRIETYIFDFDGDLYGKKITVELLGFVRKEMQFDSPEALKHQLQLDIASVKGVRAR